MSVSGGTAVVGARNHRVGSNDFQGSAYVFVQSGTAWTQQAELTPSDGASGDDFGTSVSVSGGTAVVGAPGHDFDASPYPQGGAYVFVQSGTTWTQQAALTASDGSTRDGFGGSVSVSGGTAVVGALDHPVGSSSSQGSAYVFAVTCTTGYAGSSCQYSDTTTCNSRGTAQPDGSCTCAPGWTGSTCATCSGSACSEQWLITGRAGCSMTPGRTGRGHWAALALLGILARRRSRWSCRARRSHR